MTESDERERRRAWALAADEQRAAWDRWAERLRAARHPSLARVTRVERDGDEGVLVVVDVESEAVDAWVARTAASVPDRLSVLGAAAAALDALHTGSGTSDGVPHGGVGTESTRVDTTGATRLVDFAPWTGDQVGSARFRAPELQPGGAATRAGDAWAFARLVAEVLGGARVAAATDVPALVRELRVSPDTRRRTRLVKAVETVLTSPPEARTQPLTAWLASAVEGTAATDVAGVARSPEPGNAGGAPPRLPRPGRRRLRVAAALGLGAVLVAGGVAAGSWLRDDGPPTSPESKPTVVHDQPFFAEAEWAEQCGGGTGIAAEGTLPNPTDPVTAADLAATADDLQGGRWHRARLLVTVRTWDDGDDVTLLGLTAPDPVETDPPRWRVTRTEGCGEPVEPDQRYSLDLDTLAVELEEPGLESKGFTRGTVVLTTEPIVIAIDVTACRGNHRWEPGLRYLGSGGAETLPLELQTLFGAAVATRAYTIGGGRERPHFTREWTGADPACS